MGCKHAQARIAACRGNRDKAGKPVEAAKAALDPHDGAKALADLQQKANQNDPFIQCLLGQTYEKLGEKEKARECYRKAAAARAHNPPAYAVPFARRKLAPAP